eukprot:jgi/Botrbrau1/16788/Bobra.150_2s0018.2
MCGADQRWNESAMNPATYEDFHRSCHCTQMRLFGLSEERDIICSQQDQVHVLSASWKGVICNFQNHVIALCLAGNQLSGSLPSEWAALSQLRLLDLSHNRLEGSLPSEWGQLKSLAALDINTNLLTGTLPAQWMDMENLTTLHVERNSLVGSLPKEWGQLRRLRDINVGQNNLSGTLPPPWMGMEDLTTLSMGENSLRGSLPSEWGRLRRLATLDMRSNLLSGTLPAQWSGMEKLTNLFLWGNGLVGSLPSEWGKLTRLETLDMRSNLLNGTLPAEWKGMENLTTLLLWDNRLIGSLPSEWGQLGRLMDLNIGNITLSGTLPAQWAGMTDLAALFLQENNLSGPVPWREWANLTNLMDLQLVSNSLTGSLPPDIRYPMITDLSRNHLSGSLPKRMTGAVLLNLSDNSLSGALPDPLTAPDLAALYIRGNPGLHGPVPDCWLYHRACLPKLIRFASGVLMRETANSYSWRMRNCRDELAFEWGNRGNITSRTEEVLRTVGVKRNIPFEDDIKALCSNQNVPQVLGGVWGCFLALVLACYATRKVVIPRVHALLQSRWGSGGHALTNLASALTASIYWYDLVTDVMVIKTVWPAWTGGLLLAFGLLSYVVSGWIIVLHALRQATLAERHPPPDLSQVKLTLWTIGWPLITAVMPLLDTVVLLLYLLEDTYMPFVQIRGLSKEGFMHMRDIVKALTTSLPTAVLTSVVYAMGSTPGVGLVYTKGIFVASMVGSLLLVVCAWYSALFECHVEGIEMWELFRRVFRAQTLSPDSAEALPEAAAAPRQWKAAESRPRLPFVTCGTGPEVQLAGHGKAETRSGLSQLLEGVLRAALTPLPPRVPVMQGQALLHHLVRSCRPPTTATLRARPAGVSLHLSPRAQLWGKIPRGPTGGPSCSEFLMGRAGMPETFPVKQLLDYAALQPIQAWHGVRQVLQAAEKVHQKTLNMQEAQPIYPML